jgi:hypothetical protein
MAILKIIGLVDNANSTSNSSNQANNFSARAVTLCNYGATPALLTIVPAVGVNTTFVMIPNSYLSLLKNANDVITSNSTTLSVSRSTITGG